MANSSRYVDEVPEREAFKRANPREGLHFQDLKNVPLVERPGRGTKGMHFELSGNRTIDAHVSEIPPRGHNRMHRHVNEAIIYILSGRGHSILRESEESEPIRIDWREGDLFSPPLFWWHQHFNDDPERPARYLAITNVPLMNRLGTFRKERLRTDDRDGES